MWLWLGCRGAQRGGGETSEGSLKEVILSSGPGGEEEHLSGGLAVRRDPGLGGRMDLGTCCSSRI